MLAIVIYTSLLVVVIRCEVIVNTDSGPVEGVEVTTALGKKVNAFLGIPYAAPPLGDLRFKKPYSVQPWTAVFKATNFSKSCVQAVSTEIRDDGYDSGISPNDTCSEDCLTLNVWVPTETEYDTAVMVYFFGGGFEGGTSAQDVLDGQLLSTEGEVIVVTLNYRLNVFGFLYLDSDASPGNMGLMDQALALKWIKKNIKYFGGDAKRVTIFGHGAGAASVTHHLSIPSSRGLFQRVIAQSGTSNAVWANYDKSTAVEIADLIAAYTNCSRKDTNRDIIAKCLKKLTVVQLVEAATGINTRTPLKYSPVVDGTYLPNVPGESVENYTVNPDIDIMMGTTPHDGLIFAVPDKAVDPLDNAIVKQSSFINYIKKVFGYQDESIAKFISFFYTDWVDEANLNSVREELVKFTTDYFFLCDMNRLNELLAKNGNKIFRYQYDHQSSTSIKAAWMGTGHELEFLFGWPLVKDKGFNDKEIELSRRMIEMWSNFAKYGNPNGVRSIDEQKWPLYTNKDKHHVAIDLDLSMNVKGPVNLRTQQCAMWQHLLPKYIESIQTCGSI